MCREDLALGRGRTLGRQFNTSAATTATPMLQSNPNRVLVLITMSGSNAGNTITISTDSQGNNIILDASDVNNIFAQFRIEDYGELVTGQWWMPINTGGQPVTFLEIVSNAKADPITN